MRTPRTEAALVPVAGLTAFSEVVPAAFARQLEAEAAKLARLDWQAVADGLPTHEQGDQYGDVEWSDGVDIWQGDFTPVPAKATHWRRIHLPLIARHD